MKKLLSWLLALAMVVGTIASPVSYAQEQTAENGLVTKEDLDKVNPEDVTSYAKSYLKAHPEILKTLGEPKSVRSGAKKSISTPSKQSKSEGPARVIVVLKRKPVVDTATARGVKLPTLPSGEVSSMESTMIAEQNAVKAELEAAGVKFQSTDAKAALPANSHYTRLLNGFSAYVSPEDIPLIEANEKVQEVIFQNTYRAPKTPSMFTSNSMVFSEGAHKLGYSGQGMVVAVIDSGIDSKDRKSVV